MVAPKELQRWSGTSKKNLRSCLRGCSLIFDSEFVAFDPLAPVVFNRTKHSMIVGMRKNPAAGNTHRTSLGGFMTKLSVVIVALFILSQSGYAQPADAAVIVHQSTLNKFLNAVGPISGTEQFSVLGIHGDYTWSLKNARIELKPNQALFIADANVKIGPLSYGSVASGDVEVRYHPETNRIAMKVLKAEFEVYTKIFGKKIHITNVDAAKFYRPQFEFAGPQPVQPQVDVALPGGAKKTIFIAPVSQDLHLEQDQIVVTSQLVFSDHPIGPGGAAGK